MQRIQKTLEGANIKLALVIVVGLSGRGILKAMIAGESDAKLTEPGSTRLKCSRSDLIAALEARITANHRFLIDHHLGFFEELERRSMLGSERSWRPFVTPSGD
jgi:transposase